MQTKYNNKNDNPKLTTRDYRKILGYLKKNGSEA
jgi:hypothetical protein